ncbi:MAG TPA: hypothetical protein PKN75_10130 [Bacteroidia bacterium]|nr:hypothetical protein [Bacteroidia bacterium]HNU33939.1 hypothetical protein [Bacteroidia bacterium]
MMKKIIAILLLIFSNNCFAQTVNEKFDKLDLSENFDTSSGMWTFLANNENLFLVQDGEYILNRKTTVSPFAVMANYNYEAQAYKMVVSMKIEKSIDESGSIGIIFMAQDDGKGGFLFEINKAGLYRLRQITGGSYKYLTGDSKTGGWIKTNFTNPLNVYNLVEIKTANRKYDISLNNQYLMSFEEIAYKTGKFGVIIGPGSKGKIDFLYLFSSSKFAEAESTTEQGKPQDNPNTQSKENSPDIIALAESIIKLKTQINKLQAENDDLKKTIDAIRSADDESEEQKKNFEKTIKQLEKDNARKDAAYDSLLRVNQGLIKYKDMVAGNENSDLIITLSKNLKSEKEKTQLLNDSIASLKAELQKAKTKPAPKPNGTTHTTPPTPKQNTEFTLPKEN